MGAQDFYFVRYGLDVKAEYAVKYQPHRIFHGRDQSWNDRFTKGKSRNPQQTDRQCTGCGCRGDQGEARQGGGRRSAIGASENGAAGGALAAS